MPLLFSLHLPLSCLLATRCSQVSDYCLCGYLSLPCLQTWGDSGLRIGKLSQSKAREHFRNDNLLGNQGQSHRKNQVNLNETIEKTYSPLLSGWLRPTRLCFGQMSPIHLQPTLHYWPRYFIFKVFFVDMPFQGPGKDITYVQRMEASKHLIKSFGQQKGSRYEWQNTGGHVVLVQHIIWVPPKIGKHRFYEQQERMRIESSQADMRASKAAMGADLDVTAEVWEHPLSLFHKLKKRIQLICRSLVLPSTKSHCCQCEIWTLPPQRTCIRLRRSLLKGREQLCLKLLARCWSLMTH